MKILFAALVFTIALIATAPAQNEIWALNNEMVAYDKSMVIMVTTVERRYMTMNTDEFSQSDLVRRLMVILDIKYGERLLQKKYGTSDVLFIREQPNTVVVIPITAVTKRLD